MAEEELKKGGVSRGVGVQLGACGVGAEDAEVVEVEDGVGGAEVGPFPRVERRRPKKERKGTRREEAAAASSSCLAWQQQNLNANGCQMRGTLKGRPKNL